LALAALELLAQANKNANNDNSSMRLLLNMMPIVAIGLLFYFMLMKPETRKRQEQQRMLDNLKQNDQVVTIGGILGTVVNVDKDYVVVRIDDKTNARMRILRSAISRIETESSKGKDVERESSPPPA